MSDYRDVVRRLSEQRAAEARAAAVAKLRQVDKPESLRAWAYELQERERSGELLTEAQRNAWREALSAVPLGQIAGEFRAPPLDVLPPGMRAAVSVCDVEIA